MGRFAALLILVLGFSSFGFSQSQTDSPAGGFVIRSEVNLTQIALRSKRGTLAGVNEKDLQVFEDGTPVTDFKFDKMPPVYSAVVLADFHEDQNTFNSRWSQITAAFTSVHEKRLAALAAKGITPSQTLDPISIGKTSDLFGRVVDEFKNTSRGSASEVRAFIIVTDGQDNLRLSSAAQELISLAKNGQVIIFAIPFGVLNPDQAYFSKLASLTGGAVFPIQRSNSINWNNVFEQVYDSLDQYYAVSFPPSDAHSPRWRSLKITLKGSNDDLIYRQGYCPFAYCRIPGSPGYDGPRSQLDAKKIMTGLTLTQPQEEFSVWKGQDNLVLNPGEPMFLQDENWSNKVDWQSSYQYIKFLSTSDSTALRAGVTSFQIKKVQAKLVHPNPKSDLYDVETVFLIDGGAAGQFQVGCGWPQSVLHDQSPNECLELTRKWLGWHR